MSMMMTMMNNKMPNLHTALKLIPKQYTTVNSFNQLQ